MAIFKHRLLVLGYATMDGRGLYGYYMSDAEHDRDYAGPERELRETLDQYGEDGWEVVSMSAASDPQGQGRIIAVALTKQA